MGLNTDLMGLGMADALARRVGLPTNKAVTAAGTTSVDATVLDGQNKVVTMTATGSDGIRLPANMPLNTPFWVFNSSGSTGKVYPTVGGAINAGSTDAGLSMATHTTAVFMRISTNVTISILTA